MSKRAHKLLCLFGYHVYKSKIVREVDNFGDSDWFCGRVKYAFAIKRVCARCKKVNREPNPTFDTKKDAQRWLRRCAD